MKQTTQRDAFKIKATGNIAEKIVYNHYSKKHQVEINTDEFGYWDMKIDGATVQVKAITPFVKFDCWAINEGKTTQNINNIFKCDKFLILSLPSRVPHEYDGYVLEVDPKQCMTKVLEGSFNPEKKMSLVIPRNPAYIKKIFKITNEEEKNILEHGTSIFRKKLTK